MKGSSEPQTGFYRTFRIKTPSFQVTLFFRQCSAHQGTTGSSLPVLRRFHRKGGLFFRGKGASRASQIPHGPSPPAPALPSPLLGDPLLGFSVTPFCGEALCHRQASRIHARHVGGRPATIPLDSTRYIEESPRGTHTLSGYPCRTFSRIEILRGATEIRNTSSTAGNSMTGSERPSPEPLLKKEAPPAVLGGGRRRILEMLWKPQMP